MILAFTFDWFNFSRVNYWFDSRHLGFRLFKLVLHFLLCGIIVVSAVNGDSAFWATIWACFADQGLVTQLGISTQHLAIPLWAVSLSGGLIARVTHFTLSLRLTFSGDHCESLSSPQTPLVLGLPWLQCHNPHLTSRTTL